MANTLLEAHSKNLTSVAFPAIGTGHRNFPPHVVAAIMLEEVIKFSHLNPGTPLKDVRFVVHPKAHLIIKVSMENLFLTRLPSKTTSSGWQVDKEAIGLSRVRQFFIYV